MTDHPPINSIEIRYRAGAKYPPKPGKYAGDIGLDIHANFHDPVIIHPGGGLFVPGGFRVQFSRGWAGLVLPRSSSNRRGLHVCTGVIDNGYVGEIGAEVRNINRMDLTVEPGERIAQLVLIAAFRPDPVEVEVFEDTDRGENGWGSTG